MTAITGAKAAGSEGQVAKGLWAEGIEVAHGARTVLSGVTFSLGQGEACAIVGPNGSGKTTLLRCLLGLHEVRAGRLEIRFSHFGYVPQIRALDPLFPVTVRRALEMSFAGPAPLLFPSRRALVREAVSEALEYVGIGKLSEKLLRECSGGQLQKALIARALVHRPELLVLDEPTNSLDQAGKQDLMVLLARFRSEGAAILMTTHETEIADSPVFDSELMVKGQTTEKTARATKHAGGRP